MTAQLSLAFYMGSGRIDDRLIRYATKSRYSHVELVDTSKTINRAMRSISSSNRDGGVREKDIQFDVGKWSFVEVTGWAASDAWELAKEKLEQPYDYMGILFSQTLALNRHDDDKWFCSELCGYALGFANPHTLSPGELYYRAKEMNRAFRSGQFDIVNRQEAGG